MLFICLWVVYSTHTKDSAHSCFPEAQYSLLSKYNFWCHLHTEDVCADVDTFRQGHIWTKISRRVLRIPVASDEC